MLNKKSEDRMTSLEKALYLLFLFAESPYEYTIPQLVEKTFPLVIGVGIPLYSSTGEVRNVVSISFFK